MIAVEATTTLRVYRQTSRYGSQLSPGGWENNNCVDASAPYSPLTLNPGQTGTITLTFTPAGARGTVFHGFVGVDTLNLATVSGDELVNIPYTYKVG